MKKIYIIAVIAVFSACKKDDNNTKTDTKTDPTCVSLQTKSIGYTGQNGSPSNTYYYYNGDLLDSTVVFDANNQKVYISKYTYITKTEREVRGYDKNGVQISTIGKEILNDKKQVIESINYDKNGVVLSRVVNEYQCK